MKKENISYCDGVFSDPIPVDDLRKANADFIIVIRPHITNGGQDSTYTKFKKAIVRRFILPCYMTERNIEHLMDKKIKEHKPDIVIHLDCTNSSDVYSFNNMEYLVSDGYQQTIKQLKNHFKIPD